ncbi:MAG: hypothetical protein AAFU57_08740 [Bacteroidota bacterium]
MKQLFCTSMKHTFKTIFAFLAFGLLLTGCSDDDEGAPNFDAEIAGVYDLVEVNVSQALDIDNDGSSSTNLLDEVTCITGTLTLSENNQYSVSQSTINVTTITGGLFFADCSGTTTSSGTWSGSSNSVVFSGGTLFTTLARANDRLTNTVGEDLPGILTYVYQKRTN